MKWAAYIVALFGLTVAATAQELTGRVVDAADGQPLAGAILLAADSTGRQAGYTTTAADGAFRLRPRLGMRAASVEVSMMGYRPQRHAAARLPREIRLEAEAVKIREVEIRAPRLTLRGDTVSYNVASFTEAQDRTIADVLRKMPGIEVEKTGEIRYNGEPINKFYIEGMDLLDGRYSLATNNIRPQDVASVEVMENHQPVKALSDIALSDRAALNLRLSEHARSHWTGSLRGAGGWSPDEALWRGSAFAMRMAARSQSMLNIKGDNTGQNPTADLTQLTTDELLGNDFNRYRTPAWFSTDLTSAPLAQERTRFNRSVMASADHLWKLTDDYQLSGHVGYGYDRLTSDWAARTLRYLTDGTLEELATEQALLRNRRASGQLRLQANTERFYLRERLSADLAWSDFRSEVGGSYPNQQHASAPSFRVENDLDCILRNERRTLTLSSHVLWLSQPQWLTVERADEGQRQELDIDLVRMNHNAAWALHAGRRWTFQFKGGIAALLRRMESSLAGVEATSAAVRSSLGEVGGYFTPSAIFRTHKVHLTLDLPLEVRHSRLGAERSTALLWEGRTALRWEPAACWRLTASATLGESAPDEAQLFTATLLRDYRTLTRGITSFDRTLRRSLSAGINYRNPLNGIFTHAFVMRSWSDLPWLSERSYEGDYIVDGWLRRTNRSASWFIAGGASINIDALRGQAGVDAQWQTTRLESIQQGEPMPYHLATLTLSPNFNLRLARWFNTEYRLNYRRSVLGIEEQERSVQHAFDQQLQLNFAPTRQLVIRLTGEHYYTQLSSTQRKHLVLVDASLGWKVGERWELTLTATNLLDRDSYTYTLFDGPSRSSYRYAIRPRNLLLGASWRF